MSGIFRGLNLKGFGGKKMESWKDIADSIIGTIKDSAGDFWESNAPARALIEERATRLAKLTWEYKTEGDPVVKAQKKEQMGVVADTIETELLNVALRGEEQAKSTFKKIVSTVFKAVVKIIPAVLAAV